MFKILKNIKKAFIHVRSSIKLISLVMIAMIIIIGILSLSYKTMYSVTINGEFVGYTQNKTKLQKRINEYIEKDEANTAFIDVGSLPEYSLCLLKKDKQSNDDEIFEKVKGTSTTYYQYYAITSGAEEKYYVATKDEAESIINKLKEKNSNNIKSIAYTQKHSTELKEFSDVDTVVSNLYEKKKVIVASRSYGDGLYSSSMSYEAPSLGISLIRPISGTISSRYGMRGSGRHTGLDIAGSTGTGISAAAGGTVIFSGWDKYGLGNCVRISHGNGVVTVYGHCSNLYVTSGQTVAQGQTIAARGSTGNSTGPHLHFEVRINGTAVNPQNYVY